MRRWALLCALLVLGGCARAQHVQLLGPGPNLGTGGEGKLAVAVQDQRRAVLEGVKNPRWIGFRRTNFGSPHDVTTQSGNTLAGDVLAMLGPALTNAGFDVRRLRVRDQ